MRAGYMRKYYLLLVLNLCVVWVIESLPQFLIKVLIMVVNKWVHEEQLFNSGNSCHMLCICAFSVLVWMSECGRSGGTHTLTVTYRVFVAQQIYWQC